MSRCEERHPFSGKRCQLEEGHLERGEVHDPEPHTPEERARISESMSRDGMDLVAKWCLDKHPPFAIAEGLLTLYRQVSDLRKLSRADQIGEVLSFFAERPLNSQELFVFLAKELGVSCDVVRVGNQKTAS